MNRSPLSSRARIAGFVTAAGVTALVTTLSVAGSAGATGNNSSAADVPRLDLSGTEVWCYQDDLGSVTFYYDDLPDGHVPQAVHEQVSDASGVVWTRDDLYQENGNYFNLAVFSFAGGTAPFDRNATVTYTVTMSYDDGVTQTQSTSIDLAAECTAASPTTAPATTTPPAPEPDRFQLWEGLYGCGTSDGGAFMDWSGPTATTPTGTMQPASTSTC